ncbi:MAG: YSC84-related protein [Gammaproteobacteria bacterium]|jgi:lipid-binding SYLF domain-containing protein|nr:YSC84-related protein [Gammaproteobacteria bacterium]MDH3749191.1 YSC84-related protein [Gammaproteobacteria bacterium]MDH3805139.1 YSC84-related protein [Gammaproteobacteria bacterium]
MNIESLYRIAALVTLSALMGACSSMEWSASRIDSESDEALVVFQEQINGAEVFLNQAAGFLVFPRALRAGFGIGAETGEGALRVGGKTVDYMRITSGSIGLQAGAQARSIVIAFMTQSALEQFRNSNGWRVGIDGSVALIDIGAGKTIDSQNVRDPVVGFIFGSAGLMANLTLEGTRFTRINRE